MQIQQKEEEQISPCAVGFFVFVVCLCLVSCLFFGLLFVCGCFACGGSLDYVSVHASSTFAAFFNCLRQCIN